MLPNRAEYGVCCHPPLLEPTTCRIELVAAVVKMVVTMALETEAVVWRQWKQGSDGGSRNVGGGRWCLTAVINNGDSSTINSGI